MATIQIPAELEQSVQQLADRLGFAKEDFVRDAIEQRLAEYDEEPVLTEAQIAHMHESIAQLDRGEALDGEQVLNAWYARVSAKLAAR